MKAVEFKQQVPATWRRWGTRLSLALVGVSIAFLLARGGGGEDRLVVLVLGDEADAMDRFTVQYLFRGNVVGEKTWYFDAGDAAPRALEHRVELEPGEHQLRMLWVTLQGTREERHFITVPEAASGAITIDITGSLREIRPTRAKGISAAPATARPASARPTSARSVSAMPTSARPLRER